MDDGENSNPLVFVQHLGMNIGSYQFRQCSSTIIGIGIVLSPKLESEFGCLSGLQ